MTMTMMIRKGVLVQILRGKYAGKKGYVLETKLIRVIRVHVALHEGFMIWVKSNNCVRCRSEERDELLFWLHRIQTCSVEAETTRHITLLAADP